MKKIMFVAAIAGAGAVVAFGIKRLKENYA